VALWEFSLGVYLTVTGFGPASYLLTPPNAGMRIPSPRTGDSQLEERAAAII
jgi:hypothetical protein